MIWINQKNWQDWLLTIMTIRWPTFPIFQKKRNKTC